MRYGFDDKKLETRISLEEKDLDDAFLVKQMMQTPGWKVLNKYYESSRETYFQAEDAWVLDKDKHAMVQILAAKRSGYDSGFGLAHLIVKRAEDYLNRKNEREKEEVN